MEIQLPNTVRGVKVRMQKIMKIEDVKELVNVIVGMTRFIPDVSTVCTWAQNKMFK